MTNKEAISYLILALSRLDYTLDDIRKIRKQMEKQFDLHSGDEAERMAVHLVSELIMDQLVNVKLQKENWKEFVKEDAVV